MIKLTFPGITGSLLSVVFTSISHLGAAQKARDVQVHYRTAKVAGFEIFYREAGLKNAPVILLLHGFPSSSHMFRNLIPRLSQHYRVIAPDIPGFGLTTKPGTTGFTYTFENIAGIMDEFVTEIQLTKYALYIFDYGAPVGLRLALRKPEKITAIISQNGNAYEEGLSNGWTPIRNYWNNPSEEHRNQLKNFLTMETTKWQYTHGVLDISLVAPEAYLMDQFFLDKPGMADIQLDLLGDYQSNVAMYTTFQEYFRTMQPPVLCVWGKNDPYFLPAGAEAFKRDLPKAEIKFYDTGHFALETHADEIASDIIAFLAKLTLK